MVDTSAWYAVCDASDTHHPRARAFYEKVAGCEPLLTTVAVFVETWTLLAARLGREKALTFWQTLRETGIPILPVDQADVEAAWHIMLAFPDQDFRATWLQANAVKGVYHVLSHSSLGMPACLKISFKSAGPMSPSCGFGIRNFSAPRRMKGG